MIVKNESKIIERCLNSVIHFIDSYCICDTGSTDDTIEKIEKYFNTTSIPGKIIREPFQNFEYNRTFALNQCINMPTADYLLLLDADMILNFGSTLDDPSYFKQTLTKDAYYVFQGSPSFYYKNIRILKNNGKFSYKGVTHEYIDCDSYYDADNIDMNTVFISDIGDGGAKADKFHRDIRLLTTALECEPNNKRYTFYLANSYRDIGDFENAIMIYKKRINLGGWIQEVWYSYYSLGKCYYNSMDYANAIHYWLEGYHYFPERVENLYEIIHHYRTKQQYTLAYHFYLLAIQNKKAVSLDFLFLHKDVYSYKLDYEHSIIGYYTNAPIKDVLISFMKVLHCPEVDSSTIRNVFSNYKFYAPVLREQFAPIPITSILPPSHLLETLDFRKEGFFSSTPSIMIFSDMEIWTNTRFVNYKIGAKGEYHMAASKNIETINIICILELNEKCQWVKKSEFMLDYDRQYDNSYKGVEDIRLFKHKNQVLYSANRVLNGGDQIVIEHGQIDPIFQQTRGSFFLKMENQRKIEKNWVLFENAEDRPIKFVYSWHPFIVAMISQEDSMSTIIKKVQTPNIFQNVRSSTNGIRIEDEIWFLCHIVSHENRRYYYHIVIVINAETLNIIKYTFPFTFGKSPIEYSLGMVYFENLDAFLISYSVMDATSEYGMISKSAIEDMMYIAVV
jgi:tetratricopeptide (TPR) repeat protein